MVALSGDPVQHGVLVSTVAWSLCVWSRGWLGAFLCRVCRFPLCLCGFPLGALVFSYTSKDMLNCWIFPDLARMILSEMLMKVNRYIFDQLQHLRFGRECSKLKVNSYLGQSLVISHDTCSECHFVKEMAVFKVFLAIMPCCPVCLLHCGLQLCLY